MAIVLPIIHLNGTSREALVEARRCAGQAVRVALNALTDMAPSKRDYYPVVGLWEHATAQQCRRVETLRALLEELREEVEALDT